VNAANVFSPEDVSSCSLKIVPKVTLNEEHRTNDAKRWVTNLEENVKKRAHFTVGSVKKKGVELRHYDVQNCM
jgi:hypothetical protein